MNFHSIYDTLQIDVEGRVRWGEVGAGYVLDGVS